jgi:hypothetical protein
VVLFNETDPDAHKEKGRGKKGEVEKGEKVKKTLPPLKCTFHVLHMP